MSARYSDYAEITARFHSRGTCGHEIRKGDTIGYARKGKFTQCTECWSAWVAENREADAIEAGYMPCAW